MNNERHSTKSSSPNPTTDNFACLSCGSRPCGACTQLTEFQARVDEAQLSLTRTLEQQRKLKVARNQQHDPFHRFPVEIASDIFSLCMPPLALTDDPTDGRVRATSWHDSPSTQFTLGAVCQWWREIIWNNPIFWVEAWINLHRHTPLSRCALVKEWLQRSRTRHWKLVLKVQTPSKPSRNPPDYLMEAILEVLSHDLHRCSLAYLNIMPFFISRLTCQITTGSALKWLVLHPSPDPTRDAQMVETQHYDGFDIGFLPELRLLALRHYQLDTVRFDSRCLCDFRAFDLQPFECLQILRIPTLVQCAIHEISESEFSVQPLATTELVICPALQKLELRGEVPGLLELLSAPELLTLKCESSGDFDAVGPVDGFIRRSKCQLQELHMFDTNSDGEDLIALLNETPLLATLVIQGAVDDDFFQKLAETASWSDKESAPFLPELQSFSYEGPRDFSWSQLPDIAGLTPNALHTCRRPLRSLDFALDHNFYNQEELLSENDIDCVTKIQRSTLTFRLVDDSGMSIIERLRGYYQEQQEGI